MGDSAHLAAFGASLWAANRSESKVEWSSFTESHSPFTLQLSSQACQKEPTETLVWTLLPEPHWSEALSSRDWRCIHVMLLFEWPSNRITDTKHVCWLCLLYEFSSQGERVCVAGGASMAKPLLKIQRYFRRKPVRFFSLILLYLTAGSLVFLHSGFVGDSGPRARGGPDPVAASETGSQSSSSDGRGLGIMNRVFKETRRSGRRYGPPWMKKTAQVSEGRDGDYTNNWNRALKGRNAKEEDGRGASFQTRFHTQPFSPGQFSKSQPPQVLLKVEQSIEKV